LKTRIEAGEGWAEKARGDRSRGEARRFAERWGWSGRRWWVWWMLGWACACGVLWAAEEWGGEGSRVDPRIAYSDAANGDSAGGAGLGQAGGRSGHLIEEHLAGHSVRGYSRGPEHSPVAFGTDGMLREVGVRRPPKGWLGVGLWEAWCYREEGSSPGLSPSPFPVRKCVIRRAAPGVEGGAGETEEPSDSPVARVLGYLKGAFAEPAISLGGGEYQFERRDEYDGEWSWRTVRVGRGSDGSGVRVQWWCNDDWGLSELREFFEADFFSLEETLALYRWMGIGGAHEGEFSRKKLAVEVLVSDEGMYFELQWVPKPVME
jgi:hypothetical protein